LLGLLHHPCAMQRTEVVARRTARLAEPPPELGRRRGALGVQDLQQLQAQRMRERAKLRSIHRTHTKRLGHSESLRHQLRLPVAQESLQNTCPVEIPIARRGPYAWSDVPLCDRIRRWWRPANRRDELPVI